jgi:tRNA nucleotidyltransferase/poly(A) polymerase
VHPNLPHHPKIAGRVNQPSQAREFAISVVKKLHDAGFHALWAGGCVRDQRLGREPKDYDVATDATPEQIREVLGRRRTLEIGAAFGVITVLGGKQAGQVDVATFRRDANYSDGRHPDHVTFSSAEEDARRRDFTINGLFHDPLTGQDIDYVNGGNDLQRKLIRAIGNPHERVAEDKLRMLRAVRFAATFDFAIEGETLAALLEHATELAVVSAERITEEMRRMLVHPSRRTAVELLAATGLLAVILPEVADSARYEGQPCQGEQWEMTLKILEVLDSPSFAVAFAILLRGIDQGADDEVTNICRSRRLSNKETSGVRLCLQHEALLRGAHQSEWPQVQRVLTSSRIDELLTYVAAVSDVLDDEPTGLAFCRDKLVLPTEQWNPAPLVTGDDLKAAGLPPGPDFRRILDGLRDAQLVGKLVDKSDALAEAKRLWTSQESP